MSIVMAMPVVETSVVAHNWSMDPFRVVKPHRNWQYGDERHCCFCLADDPRRGIGGLSGHICWECSKKYKTESDEGGHLYWVIRPETKKSRIASIVERMKANSVGKAKSLVTETREEVVVPTSQQGLEDGLPGVDVSTKQKMWRHQASRCGGSRGGNHARRF